MAEPPSPPMALSTDHPSGEGLGAREGERKGERKRQRLESAGEQGMGREDEMESRWQALTVAWPREKAELEGRLARYMAALERSGGETRGARTAAAVDQFECGTGSGGGAGPSPHAAAASMPVAITVMEPLSPAMHDRREPVMAVDAAPTRLPMAMPTDDPSTPMPGSGSGAAWHRHALMTAAPLRPCAGGLASPPVEHEYPTAVAAATRDVNDNKAALSRIAEQLSSIPKQLSSIAKQMTKLGEELERVATRL